MVNASPTMTAARLSRVIEKQTGVPRGSFALYHASKPMCGTLEESGVASGSTVELKFRGRGGGPEPPSLTTRQDNDFPDEPPMPHSSRMGLGQLVSSGGTQETDTPASNQAANSLEIEVEPQPARSVSLATRVMRSYDNDGDVVDDLDPPISLVEQEAQPQQEEWPSRLSTPLRDPSQRLEMPAASSTAGRRTP